MSDLGAGGDGDHPGRRRHRRQSRKGGRGCLPDQPREPPVQVRGQVFRQVQQAREVDSAGDLDPRAEAQRMLERMEPFEDDQARIVPRRDETPDLRRVGQAALSSSRTMVSPITAVDTLAMPGCMMSAVRRPPARTLAIAPSSRSAASSWSNE